MFALGVFSNRLLLWAIVFELVFAALLIYVPFMQPVFGTASLGWQWWLLLAAFVPVVFLVEEARKLYLRLRSARPAGASSQPSPTP